MMGNFLPEPDELLERMPWHWLWAFPMIILPFMFLDVLSEYERSWVDYLLLPLVTIAWLVMVVGYLLLIFWYGMHEKTHTLLRGK